MSAPETSIDTQKKRHKASLAGIFAVVVVALALLFGLMSWLSAESDPAEGSTIQIDGRTGAEEPANN